MIEITDNIKELLSLTDLVLLDIKHINSDKKSIKWLHFGVVTFLMYNLYKKTF